MGRINVGLLIQEGALKVEEIVVAGYEKVYKIEDPSVGLQAIICLHSLALGPALGGIRIYPYTSWDAALTDVKRLAEAMSYKASISSCSLGGGKSVIIAAPHQKTEELLRSFGRAIELLGGVYIGAEDVGSSPADILVLSQVTKYVTGLPHKKSSGNPSAFTAWGVYRGIQAGLKEVYGSESVKGKTVAIQGVGSVGSFLADMLFWNGAHLVVADVSVEKAQDIARKYGGTYVSSDEIFSIPCDVFAPCALGGILNSAMIPDLKCKIVAGAANNQLLVESDADILRSRGILYAPDFVINAGGLLNVTEEIMPEGYNPVQVREKIDGIWNTLLMIFALAEEQNCSTHEAAKKMARYHIENKIGARTQPPCFHHAL